MHVRRTGRAVRRLAGYYFTVRTDSVERTDWCHVLRLKMWDILRRRTMSAASDVVPQPH